MKLEDSAKSVFIIGIKRGLTMEHYRNPVTVLRSSATTLAAMPRVVTAQEEVRCASAGQMLMSGKVVPGPLAARTPTAARAHLAHTPNSTISSAHHLPK